VAVSELVLSVFGGCLGLADFYTGNKSAGRFKLFIMTALMKGTAAGRTDKILQYIE
jgi:hypothetical protein